MKNLRHKTILCLLITILIINLGCAHHLPPLSEEVSANLGTIGVCTSSHYAHLYFSTKPVTDWGEGCNMGLEIVGGELELCFYDPQMLLLWPIIIPVFLVSPYKLHCGGIINRV